MRCAGVTGANEFEADDSTVVIRFENRLHEKSLFGLVTGNWEFEVKNNGQVALAGTFIQLPDVMYFRRDTRPGESADEQRRRQPQDLDPSRAAEWVWKTRGEYHRGL